MPVAPDFAAALASHQAGDLQEAERRYREILAGRLDVPSLDNLALVLGRLGRPDEALALRERAVEAMPFRPEGHLALADERRAARRLEAAEPAYRRVLQLAPEHEMATVALAMTLLAMGRYDEGFGLYERRPRRRELLESRLTAPEWRGQSLAGKRLLVWREQGFGDQIMMARFLRGLDAREVVYAGLAPLRRLMEQLGVRYQSLAPEEGASVAGADYWVMTSSLPAIFGARPEALPPAGYFSGTPRPAGGRVGLAWRGDPRNANEAFRALPEPLARRLLDLPGVISLAPEDTGARDFQDTADIIAGLDLVISVDTSVAHLAGAMARPLWVLLPARGLDWQWMNGQADSPWYPTARLIWQARAGDWTSLVDGVAADLEAQGFLG